MAAVPPDAETLLMSSPDASTLLECGSEMVAIEVSEHGRRLVAALAIPEGTRLFFLEGRETDRPTRYSVQIGAGLHLDTDCARDEDDLLARFFWRYLDHSCDPSVVIRERVVYALRDIEPGESVTFDYNTTELDMAEPFRCRCGTARCVGTVRGAQHLTATQRRRVQRLLPDYLR